MFLEPYKSGLSGVRNLETWIFKKPYGHPLNTSKCSNRHWSTGIFGCYIVQYSYYKFHTAGCSTCSTWYRSRARSNNERYKRTTGSRSYLAESLEKHNRRFRDKSRLCIVVVPSFPWLHEFETRKSAEGKGFVSSLALYVALVGNRHQFPPRLNLDIPSSWHFDVFKTRGRAVRCARGDGDWGGGG
jgi:hypothetical protein